jgi:hypothetical protein
MTNKAYNYLVMISGVICSYVMTVIVKVVVA